MEKEYFAHESSYVDAGCLIGKGTKIWHFSHVMSNCVIGENCNIGQNVVIQKVMPGTVTAVGGLICVKGGKAITWHF